MPLSEHEQRILAELEDSLAKEDPRFVKSVREKNVYAHGGRRVRWGVAGFVAGLAILVVFFSRNVLVGLVGVALMFVSALVIERNARLLGRASWQDITRSAHGDDVPANVGPRTRSLRDWLSRQRRKQQ
jgi:type IV secretory pathway VirB3-like protein